MALTNGGEGKKRGVGGRDGYVLGPNVHPEILENRLYVGNLDTHHVRENDVL